MKHVTFFTLCDDIWNLFGSAHQMSSTNQTLATLAGGFVPMLLKNVLSTKSAKLNLKTLSFKGQIDEIVAEYKQNWPIYDAVLERYDPEAESAEKEDKEGEKDDKGGDIDNKENEDKGTKDQEEEKGKQEASAVDKDKEDTITVVNEKQNDEAKEKLRSTFPQNNTSSLGSNLGASLKPPPSYEDSAVSYLSPGGRGIMRRLSIVPPEDNFVDLFIDLSVTEDNNPWHFLYGSSESIQSMTMMADLPSPRIDKRMPYDQELEAPNNGRPMSMSHY